MLICLFFFGRCVSMLKKGGSGEGACGHSFWGGKGSSLGVWGGILKIPSAALRLGS